jgi:hypothetical protein
MKNLKALKNHWVKSEFRGSFNLELYYKYLKAIE